MERATRTPRPATTALRVVVGLSGGVDSAVAAHLLIAAGHEVEAVFMKNWIDTDDDVCPAAEDLADAEAVCRRLGIRLTVVNFAPDYWDRVFARFLADHRSGRTPNPDVLCNTEIKFRAFLDHALEGGAAAIATGHYARIVESEGRYRLLRAADRAKDQSYFLHGLTQEQLGRALFPLGGLTKPEVRRIAAEIGLSVHAKRDSTGICFIGERRFDDFLARYLPRDPGAIVTPRGEVVGRHRGLAFYTIGQRQGLGIGGRHGADDAPWYVAGKEAEGNRLVVVQGHDHPLLLSTALTAPEIHWIAGAPPPLPLHCTAQIRYRQPPQTCTVAAGGDDLLTITFDLPQRAVTPGQYAVLYDGDDCLGGGVIDGTTPVV